MREILRGDGERDGPNLAPLSLPQAISSALEHLGLALLTLMNQSILQPRPRFPPPGVNFNKGLESGAGS